MRTNRFFFFLLSALAMSAAPISAERIYTAQHVYETGKILGKGKRGKVMSATDELGNLFAIKMMFNREEQKRRGSPKAMLNHMFNSSGASKTAERAFEIGLEMDHPGIIKCYEMTFHEGRNWTILEYVEGTPVSKIRSKKFNRTQILDLAADFLDALSYAATKHIIHRDLCMQNLMVDSNNKLKLIDLDSFHSLHEERGTRRPKMHWEYVDKINLVLISLLKRGNLPDHELEDYYKKVSRLPRHTRFRGHLDKPMTPESADYFLSYFNSLRSILFSKSKPEAAQYSQPSAFW